MCDRDYVNVSASPYVRLCLYISNVIRMNVCACDRCYDVAFAFEYMYC